MPRRCRPLSASRVFGLVAGLAVAAAAALWPMPARAQTVAANAPQANTLTMPANADADLFLPSLQGSPNNPSRFVVRRNTVSANQAPPTGAFHRLRAPPGRRSMAVRRASAPAIPVSIPPMGGAGNGRACRTAARRSCRRSRPRRSIRCPRRRHRRPKCRRGLPCWRRRCRPKSIPSRAASRPGATLPPPPTELPISNVPAEVHPLTAAVRPGAVGAAATAAARYQFTGQHAAARNAHAGRPCRSAPCRGRRCRSSAAIPTRRSASRRDRFLILPAVELSAGYDNNPEHTPGGPGSSTFTVAPELHVRSDWPVHSLHRRHRRLLFLVRQRWRDVAAARTGPI